LKKKIYLYLSGGLGNQLFQYCAAKNLAIKNKSQLIIDPFSGFLTDFRHKRSIQLNKFSIKNVIYKNLFYFFYLFRFLKKITLCKKLFYNLFFFSIIDEFYSFEKYQKSIDKFKFNNKLFMLGLYQSEKYFIENKSNIIKDVIPKSSKKKIFLKEDKNISINKSVAICVRLHETLPDKLKYTAGGIVGYNFYKKALNLILKRIKNPNFFFFSTRTEYITDLLIKVNKFNDFSYKIITPQKGFLDEVDTLWLLSRFKNLVISNSTFYWWGAYFSKINYSNQFVISTNQFPNSNSNLDNWLVL
jgi:hypothetical protein